ncbi:pyridoxamine 5'-phosphate oxidase family protein [Litoreibacter albidus]|uniref:General stress protein 26 n=1 Tax=Litoreibacter albidus TaxID=670155 RepID=A0A1H2Z7I3_9RHOB|nr:pyridoxamine 5'-phosphate oxidase family protein [Litoreibacter albidus]SDX13301.1 General stress protein 26 [Litoreibacter albidus]
MADTDRTETDARGQLFDQLDDIRAGMLGVEGSGQHMQPMTHYFDRDTGELWFITSTDTDLVRAVGQGSTAHFCVQSTSQDYYACLSGPIHQSQDEAKLDEIWTAVAAAFFEDGREDKKICLLHMPLREAAIWSSPGNPLMFGFEVLRANMGDGTADAGTHKVINFAAAA